MAVFSHGRSPRSSDSSAQTTYDWSKNIAAMEDFMSAAMGSKTPGEEPAPPEPTAAEAAAAERQAKAQEFADLLMKATRERTAPSRPR